MVKKSIIWSERAVTEFQDTLEFYIERNGNNDYAFKIFNKTENLLEILQENEFLGRLTENKITRVVVMDTFLIFYEVQKQNIELLSFWDNRQNPEKRIDHI